MSAPATTLPVILLYTIRVQDELTDANISYLSVFIEFSNTYNYKKSLIIRSGATQNEDIIFKCFDTF